jgi:hypothetical protein
MGKLPEISFRRCLMFFFEIKTSDPEDPAFLKVDTLPRLKAPDSIVLDLLPYQEEGYGWMVVLPFFI